MGKAILRGQDMKLGDVVAHLETYDDETTIYAARHPGWSVSSPAMVLRALPDGSVPPEAASSGLEYFLDVFVAKDVLEHWCEATGEDYLSTDEKCRIVIHYATHDAYPQV